MDNWITATISPPPASAFPGMAWAIQLHQPTGAAVAIMPHSPSSTATITVQAPKGISARAITAISSGRVISVR
ncbi:hypothetical protein D3C78_1655140 [compost metagenome]